jgi:antitoxin (DNA-binding transcriptional repressor) of toxin-antitoxin stability system
MHSVNIQEAKKHLSKYIEFVQQGDEVIICKNGDPVAFLRAYPQHQGQRKLGAWKGKVEMAEDFDDLPDSFMEQFKI